MLERTLWLSCAVAVCFGAGGCGGSAPSAPKADSPGRAPDLIGLSLDEAERELGIRGQEDYVYANDEVIIRSNWTVCSQYPEPGARAAEIDLYVAHFGCDGNG